MLSVGYLRMIPLAEKYEKIVKERGNLPTSENESISEKLVPDFVETQPEFPKWVKEGVTVSEDVINIEIPVEDSEVFVEVTERKTSTKAQKVLQLIASGEKPGLAARKVRTTIGDLMRENNFKGALKELIENRYAPNEVRREMVRAYLNDTLMSNAGQGSKREKLALAAAKEIAKDPDVGLNTPPVGNVVTVDLGKLGDLLSKTITLPGLDKIIDNDEKEVNS